MSYLRITDGMKKAVRVSRSSMFTNETILKAHKCRFNGTSATFNIPFVLLRLQLPLLLNCVWTSQKRKTWIRRVDQYYISAFLSVRNSVFGEQNSSNFGILQLQCRVISMFLLKKNAFLYLLKGLYGRNVSMKVLFLIRVCANFG